MTCKINNDNEKKIDQIKDRRRLITEEMIMKTVENWSNKRPTKGGRNLPD